MPTTPGPNQHSSPDGPRSPDVARTAPVGRDLTSVWAPPRTDSTGTDSTGTDSTGTDSTGTGGWGPPAPPPAPETAAAVGGPRATPGLVRVWFWAWVVVAALAVGNAVDGLVSLPQVSADAATAGTRVPGGAGARGLIQGVAVGGLVLAVVVDVVFAGLLVVFALYARRARRWARVALAITGGVGVVMSLLALASAGRAALSARTGLALIDGAFTLVSVLLSIGAGVLLFLPPTNRYLAATGPW